MKKLLLSLLFFLLAVALIGSGYLNWKQHKQISSLESQLRFTVKSDSETENFQQREIDWLLNDSELSRKETKQAEQRTDEVLDAWEKDSKSHDDRELASLREQMRAAHADTDRILQQAAKKTQDSIRDLDQWIDRQRAIDAQERSAAALEDLSFQAQWDSLQREIDKPFISYPRKKSGE
jgi:hypothetical protein